MRKHIAGKRRFYTKRTPKTPTFAFVTETLPRGVTPSQAPTPPAASRSTFQNVPEMSHVMLITLLITMFTTLSARRSGLAWRVLFARVACVAWRARGCDVLAWHGQRRSRPPGRVCMAWRGELGPCDLVPLVCDCCAGCQVCDLVPARAWQIVTALAWWRVCGWRGVALTACGLAC
jgi:hypothetical protein